MFTMTMNMKITILVCIALLMGGCGSMLGHHSAEDFEKMPLGSDPTRLYQSSYDIVKQAAIYSMQQTGLENIAEHQLGGKTWYVTGEVGYSWRSNGQFIRIAVQPDSASNPPRTKVFYSALKRFDMNVTEDLKPVQDKLLNYMDTYIETH